METHGLVEQAARSLELSSDSIVTQTKTGSPEAARKSLILKRRRSESNRRIKVLQYRKAFFFE